MFARAKSIEGKLFMEFLENDEKSVKCLKEALEIGQSQKLTYKRWYREASDLLKKATTKKKEQARYSMQDNSEILKKIAKEISLLNEAKGKSWQKGHMKGVYLY